MNKTTIEQRNDDQRNYRVVFEGKLVNGASIEDVKINVAKIYGKETSEISKMFDGKKVIIKKKASLSICNNIKEKLYKAGAECRIEEEDLNDKNLDSASNRESTNKVVNIKDYKQSESSDDLDYKSIIQSLSVGLSGNTEEDLKFLFDQRKIYFDHANSIEICRAIGRLIYEVLPVEERNNIEAYYEKLDLSTDIIIAEIDNKLRAGELEQAEKIVSSIMPDENYFKEDDESKYFCFDNIFETMFYLIIFKPKKKPRYISNFIVNCSMKYAYILFEKKEYDKALQLLDRGLYYNPININLLFEKSEIYKVKKDWKNFKEINDYCLNVAYTPANVARAYRNYGYMYIEKADYEAAICCYLLSTMFEINEHANSQLFYISQVIKKAINHEKYFKKLKKIFEKRSLHYGLSDDVSNVAYGGAHYYEEKNMLDEAIYFLEICYSLYKDDEILDHIEVLKNNKS